MSASKTCIFFTEIYNVMYSVLHQPSVAIIIHCKCPILRRVPPISKLYIDIFISLTSIIKQCQHTSNTAWASNSLCGVMLKLKKNTCQDKQQSFNLKILFHIWYGIWTSNLIPRVFSAFKMAVQRRPWWTAGHVTTKLDNREPAAILKQSKSPIF